MTIKNMKSSKISIHLTLNHIHNIVIPCYNHFIEDVTADDHIMYSADMQS